MFITIHCFYKLILYILPSSIRFRKPATLVALEQTLMTAVPVPSQQEQNTSDPPIAASSLF